MQNKKFITTLKVIVILLLLCHNKLYASNIEQNYSSIDDLINQYVKDKKISIIQSDNSQDVINTIIQKNKYKKDQIAKIITEKTSYSLIEQTHNTVKYNKVITFAKQQIGKPYRYGGIGKNDYGKEGFDCSGLVMTAYQTSLNIQLPRTAIAQALYTKPIAYKNLMPGDLVFYNTRGRKFSHVGIYYKNNSFIHSPRSGARVRIEKMNTRYWQRRFNGARRVNY